MEKTYMFTYIHAGQAGEKEKSSEPPCVELAAIEAKWRVIDYIIKQTMIKTG